MKGLRGSMGGSKELWGGLWPLREEWTQLSQAPD